MLKFALTSLALAACLQVATGEELLDRIPKVRRVEGRVTLEYVEGERRVETKLAFTEVADTTTSRSKVTIGRVSWPPTVYHTRGTTVLSVDNLSKKCLKLPDTNRVLPELDFFLRYSFTDQELSAAISKFAKPCFSPLALLMMHNDEVGEYLRTESHRGVTCSVFATSGSHRSKSSRPVEYEFLVPKVAPNSRNKLPVFTVREKAADLKGPDGTKTYNTVITVDLFYIEDIDKRDSHQANKLEDELNLPLGVGCSEFVAETQIASSPAYKSFMMSFVRGSAQDLVSLAYDHEFNYLRKEHHGQSVSIWDLNEDLLYHTDRQLTGKIYGGNLDELALAPCSVLSFDEAVDSDGPASGIPRPFERHGESLDVFKFLGLSQVHYMGQSIVRDLPCLVFETIVQQPPKIFQLEIQDYATKAASVEYILQFYVFKTTANATDGTAEDSTSMGGPLPAGLTSAMVDHYWPARINLYTRQKDTAWVHLHESLEVQDFHWGLFGWQGKPSELFMMPECFDSEEEQLRLELSLAMKQTTPSKRQTIFTNYKYKLELDLQSDLFKVFQMSRLHLTEYSLALLRHNILARMVISDRRDEKKLSHFGEGEMPSESAYKDHKLQLKTGSAATSLDGCIMTAAHLEAASMVVFCPSQPDQPPSATCTVVYGESEPAIKRIAPTAAANKAACQVYRFAPSEPPKPAAHQLELIKRKLYDYKFYFALDDVSGGQTQATTSPEMVLMEVEDFDVTSQQQLVTISNYKFAEPAGPAEKPAAGPATKLVRRFPSITYETAGDCSRVCNLDSSCRSFSYCEPSASSTSTSSASDESRCLLSSLELRQSNVELQLVQAKLDSNLQVTVEARGLNAKNSTNLHGASYVLDLKSGCSIRERDFLSIFTRTNEFLRIRRQFAVQFSMASSATDCARRVIDLEDVEESHHGAAFAYCAGTGTCLSDENLFGTVKNAEAESVADEDEPNKTRHDELSCQLFRKRYQTYFELSSLVVKRGPESAEAAPAESDSIGQNDGESSELKTRLVSGGLRQIELARSSVEECARACWNSFGHVCVSFDYCSPQVCLINSIGGPNDNLAYDPKAVEYESRSDCLGYRRDLKWDQLRRDHLIGKHSVLGVGPGSDEQTNGKGGRAIGWLWNILLIGLAFVLFDFGLIMGQKLNDRLQVGLLSGGRNGRGGGGALRSGALTESTRNLARFRDGPALRNTVQPDDRTSIVSKFNIENETYDYANAIQMDEIGTVRNGHSEASASNDLLNDHQVVRQQTAAAAPKTAEPKPTPKRPDYIDVPNLI